MKHSISQAKRISLLVILCNTIIAYYGQAQFQEVYENVLSVTDNSFHKIIKDGQDYYILGSEDGHATITRTNSSGGLLWTRSLPMPSVWADGIIRSGVSGSARLYVVGYTLPFDNTNSSLIGEITPAGNFMCIKSLDVPGNESLTGIDENTPGTYSVVGTQTLPSSTQDVILMSVSFPGCIINSKHIFNSPVQDNFANDIEVLCNGDAMVAGEVNGTAVLYQVSSGQFLGGVQNPVQYTYKDLSETSNCEILVVANPIGAGWPKIMRFDASLLPVWEASVFGLTSLQQVEEDVNGNILAVGTTTISGIPRTVVLKINDGSGPPTLSWGGAKYFGTQATGYTPGAVTPFFGPPFSGRVAYVDGRTGQTSGFGLTDAFLAITDGNLESACTYTIGLDLIIEETLFDGPEAEVLSYDTPPSTMETFLSPEWIQAPGCDTSVVMDTCCTDSLAFIAAAQDVLIYNSLVGCDLTYTIEDLTDCMQMLVDWGDHQLVNIVSGNPATISHTYTGSGSYTVCFTIQEINNGEVCWEYEICESVEVECDTSILNCGQAVLTCFSQYDQNVTDGYVMAIVDIRNRPNGILPLTWNAPAYHHPDWVRSKMGEVFGIAIDKNNDIYVTATKTYLGSNFNSAVGPAGAGGIYKISENTGAFSPFVFTNPSGSANTVNTNFLPNAGSGLGNICYDELHDQFYVTNFEDGRIYSIKASGINAGMVLQRYDPFTPDNGLNGVVCLGERLWGIGYHNGRLYFGRWNQDNGSPGNGANEIFSIDILATGMFGNNLVNEITIPPNTSSYGTNSSPISDIEFSHSGKMLVSERSMSSGQNCSFYTATHTSRVLEYTGSTGSWSGPKQFYVGNWNPPHHANAAGGVDYGYQGLDPVSQQVYGCDSMVWATGDALRLDNQSVYGLAGMPSSGNLPAVGLNFAPLQSWYIDADGDVFSQDKTRIGDVDIVKCGCPEPTEAPPCDSMLIATATRVAPFDSCCWTIDLDIQETNICRVEFDILTPGVIFSQFSASSFPILLDAVNPNSQISIHNNLSDIPTGFYAGEVDFCLTNITNANQVPQYVVVKYYKCTVDTEVLFCRDTLEFPCSYPETGNGCWSSKVDSVYCNPNNQSYTIKLTVTNEDDSDTYNYLGILNVLPSACFTLTSPSVTALTNPLGPGDSEQVCLTVNANKFIADTTNIYFQFYLFGDFACCHAQDSLCIPLPPCCAPCENASVLVDSTASEFDSCCYTLDVINGCANNFFKRIETEIITPGVKFSQAQVISSLPYLWYTPFGNDTEIHWAPQGGFIPVQSFDNLINFCLTDINNPSQNPQYVEIRWIACDLMGKDSIACVDTLKFYCPPVKRDSCIEVLERKVVCLPDGSYQFNYTVQNISTNFASHFVIYNVSPSPPISISGLGGPGLVNLFPLGTYSGTLNITGGQAGDIVKLKARLFDFTPPPPQVPIDTAWCCFDTICIVLPPCDTCYCPDPSFTNLILHWDNGPGQTIHCETGYENIPCPLPGNGYFLTGKFECEGDSCEMEPYVSWDLEDPLGNHHFGSSVASPFFAISLLPSYTINNGIYTTSLTSFCGQDTCTCEFQFVVDCDTLCPCEAKDILALSHAVSQGFAISTSSLSCQACFTPIALSDCEKIEWHLNNSAGPLLGLSIGNQTFCHTFPNSGTYTIVMVVTRFKPDGTLCESFAKSETVSLTCIVNPGCPKSVFENSTFIDGASPGGFNSGGTSKGWTSILKELQVIEGQEGSLDGWTINLYGNLDAAGVLTTIDPICLARDTGTVNVRLRGGPIPGIPGSYDPPRGRGKSIKMQVYQGDSFQNGNCDTSNCIQLASIDLEEFIPGLWYDVSIPYDFRSWYPNDSCGTGLIIRPAVYVSNKMSTEQGGEETYSAAQIDNFCWDGLSVAVQNPTIDPAVSIYPNPTTGSLTVALPNPAVKGMLMRIVDLTGQLILERKAEVGKTVQGLEVAYLPQGMYFLQMMSYGRTLSVSKFVKQ